MANKRTLKRSINLVCSELFAECVATSLYDSAASKENVEAMIFSIIRMECDFLSRISHPEPGVPTRAYFRRLRSDFSIEVSGIIDQINNL